MRRGLAVDLAEAHDLIERRRVRVSGAIALKPDRQVDASEPLIVETPPRYVSRAGVKLEGALGHFAIDVEGRCALDVGASTGGFTDCLLQHGARHVYTVDVGTNQLHERCRDDPRVTVRERTDVRRLRRGDLPSDVDLVTVDVSFVSVAPLAGHLRELAGPRGRLVVLVKPQFEASRAEADRGRGVIVDPEVWRRALLGVARAFEAAGSGIMGVMVSPLRGVSGNTEFFLSVDAVPHPDPADTSTTDALVEAALGRVGP